MLVSRAYTVLAVLLAMTPAFAGQPKAAQAPRPKARPQNAAPKPDNHPGEQLFTRLERMTPVEREKALSQLPPARRAQIEKRIQNFQKLPPAVQERRLDRLERLNSLPPLAQAQVRRSVNQLQNLPDDRRRAINQELRRMSVMPEDERQPYMNSEDFHNRFSPSEQQIVSDVAKIE
jgi:hypothetical protein